MKTLILFFSISLFCSFGYSQNKTPQDVCLSKEELKLYKLINQYRKSNGLPNIPLSKSLTYVAQTHVKDLEGNKASADANCNMHSWSDKGDWTSCCYTPDHAQAECMWNKPRELTSYTGNGFEISHGSSTYDSYVSTAENSLKGWQGSKGHNAVIINKGVWERFKWQAVGIGIYGSFAVVWFGAEEDSEGSADRCK